MNITDAVFQLGFQYPDDGYECPSENGPDVLLLCTRADGIHKPGELVAGCDCFLPEFSSSRIAGRRVRRAP